MFGLAEEIGRAHLAVYGVIGDDHCLGGAGEKVDADAAVKLALGLGDEDIARADEHVDRFDGLGPEGHRADRLHAAQHVDLVRAAEVHRRDDGRVRCAADRRGRGHDARDARDMAVRTDICAEATMGNLPPGT